MSSSEEMDNATPPDIANAAKIIIENPEYVPPEFRLDSCGHYPSEEDLNDDTLHSFGPVSEQRRTWSWTEEESESEREEQQKAEETQMLDEEPKRMYKIKDGIYLRDFPSDGGRPTGPGARAVPALRGPGPGSRGLLARDFGRRLLVMEFDYDSLPPPSPTCEPNIENYFQGTIREQLSKLKHVINSSVIDFKGNVKDLSTQAESISDKWFCFKPTFDNSTIVEEEEITKISTVNFKTDTQEKGNSNRDIEDPDKITTSTNNNSRCIVHSTDPKRHTCYPTLHAINSSQTLAVEIETKETTVSVRDLDSNFKNSCDATVFTTEISAQTETDMAETIPVTLSNNYGTSITANKFSDIGTGFPKLPRNPRQNSFELNTCGIKASTERYMVYKTFNFVKSISFANASQNITFNANMCDCVYHTENKSDETAVVGIRAPAISTINVTNVFLSAVGTCTAKLPRNPKIDSDEYNLYYEIVGTQIYSDKYINIEKARSTNTTVSVGLDPTIEITRITNDGKQNFLHSALNVFNNNLIESTDKCNVMNRAMIFSDVRISTAKLLRNPKQSTIECNTSFTTTRAVAGAVRSPDINTGIFKPCGIVLNSSTFNKESGKGNIGLTADFKVSSEAWRSASHEYLSTTNSNRSTATNNELIANAEIETDQFIYSSTTIQSDATFIKPVCTRNHDLYITKIYVTAKDIKTRNITKIKDDDDANNKMFSDSAVITNRFSGKIAIEENNKTLVHLTDNGNATNRAKMFSDVGIITTKLLHYPKQIQVSGRKLSHKSFSVIKSCRVPEGIAKSIKLNGKLGQINNELADFSYFKKSSKKTDASSYTPSVFVSTAYGNRFTASNDELISDAEIVNMP